MKRFLLIIFSLFLACAPILVCASEVVASSVADASGVISEVAERYIDTINSKLKKDCGAQIIVATAKNTDKISTHEYAQKLFKDLGLSAQSSSNCVLVVMFTDKMDYTAVVSDGISRSMTQKFAERCLAESMEPSFAKKDYDTAAIKVYNAIAAWYVDNYRLENLELTEDMTLYQDIVSGEHREATMRHINTTLVAVLLVGMALALCLYARRKLRLKKMEKKRRERRMKYLRKVNKH